MKDFYQLFETGVQDVYAAQKEIIQALPKLAQAAKEPKLKDELRHQVEETQEQINRTEKIAEELDIDLKSNSSNLMHTLLLRGNHFAQGPYPPEVKDAAIIGAVQCIEHQEMAIYGTLKAFASRLKLDLAEKSFDQNLREAFKADKKLSDIAEGTLFTEGVNKKACGQECL